MQDREMDYLELMVLRLSLLCSWSTFNGRRFVRGGGHVIVTLTIAAGAQCSLGEEAKDLRKLSAFFIQEFTSFSASWCRKEEGTGAGMLPPATRIPEGTGRWMAKVSGGVSGDGQSRHQESLHGPDGWSIHGVLPGGALFASIRAVDVVSKMRWVMCGGLVWNSDRWSRMRHTWWRAAKEKKSRLTHMWLLGKGVWSTLAFWPPKWKPSPVFAPGEFHVHTCLCHSLYNILGRTQRSSHLGLLYRKWRTQEEDSFGGAGRNDPYARNFGTRGRDEGMAYKPSLAAGTIHSAPLRARPVWWRSEQGTTLVLIRYRLLESVLSQDSFTFHLP